MRGIARRPETPTKRCFTTSVSRLNRLSWFGVVTTTHPPRLRDAGQLAVEGARILEMLDRLDGGDHIRGGVRERQDDAVEIGVRELHVRRQAIVADRVEARCSGRIDGATSRQRLPAPHPTSARTPPAPRSRQEIGHGPIDGSRCSIRGSAGHACRGRDLRAMASITRCTCSAQRASAGREGGQAPRAGARDRRARARARARRIRAVVRVARIDDERREARARARPRHRAARARRTTASRSRGRRPWPSSRRAARHGAPRRTRGRTARAPYSAGR